jgi:putative aldouronate transport system substrate-binding protein
VGLDGNIHFGNIEPGYRQWMTMMAQWYKEGLLDPDLPSMQTSQVAQKLSSGTSGATIAAVGSGMGTWTPAARQTNPKYELIALGPPQRVKGEKVVYGNPSMPYSGQNAVAISASCKNVEIAARFLDWGYSEAGHLYYNFGIEGESYTMVNGYPTYTSLVLNSPKGWSVGQAISAYDRATGAGPFVQDGRHIIQYYTLPEQKKALENFPVPGATAYALPPVTPTQEESREFATIMNEINIYSDEMMTKFILGTEILNDASWNTFVSTIRRMGIDRATAIQAAALNRYKAR